MLPKKRLYCGFGTLTFGGLAGMVISLPVVAVALINGLDGAAYLGRLFIAAVCPLVGVLIKVLALLLVG